MYGWVINDEHEMNLQVEVTCAASVDPRRRQHQSGAQQEFWDSSCCIKEAD